MDIACPQCAAAYEVDATTLGPAGRRVRCATCGTVWRAMPPGDEAPPAEAAAPAPEAPAPAEAVPSEAPPKPAKTRWIADAPPGRRRSAWRRLADWRTGAVAATILLAAAGLHQREQVVRHLPQTARLYAAIGYPVNLRGIEIRNVRSRMAEEGEDSVLVVDGELANVSGRRLDVPRLHFSLTGADGRPLYAWDAPAERPALEPGESLSFRRRLAAPPAEARDVSVRFVARSDITAGIK